MADVKYTPEQQKAIDTTDKALLLSAAAGSGKTAVLVQRILKMVSDETNDVNIDNLLIVTFTNMAASQMRERIHKELIKRVKENPQNKKLKKQVMLLAGAHIKTIHSFCLDTIKANINCVDIPVNFRVIDKIESASLMNQAISELIEEKYMKNDPDFLALIDTYGYSASDEKLVSIVFSIYNTVKAMADGDGFLDSCLENIRLAGEKFSDTVFSGILLRYCKEILDDNIRKYKYAIDLCADNNDPKIIRVHNFFIAEKDILLKIYDAATVDELYQMINSLTFPTKPSASGEINDIVKNIRDDCKADVGKIKDFLICSEQEEEKSQKEIYGYIRILVDFIREFDERFTLLKRKKGGIDYKDFEQLAYKILKNEDGSLTNVALCCRKKFHEVLIDEYQDTSDIQNAIFDAVSRDGSNLFTVGDVKQSIYKFRQARPENFALREIEYEKNKKEKLLIKLAHNFRSRSEVVDCVNKIFIPIMTKKTGLTEYEEQKLICGGDFKYNENADYKTEVLLFENPRNAVAPQKYEGKRGEALMVVQRIKELMANENHLIFDKEKNDFRPLKYDDIVILFRSLNANIKSIYECMNEYGIPVSAEFSEAYFSQTEIRLIIGILKCIDNPRDDINLITVMKSPAFRFSEDELLKIRMIDKNVPFYEALLKSEEEKSVRFIKTLKDLIEKSFYMEVSELVSTVYDVLKLPERMCAYKNPKQRVFNLDAFYDIALGYDTTQSGTLKSFIFYISKLSLMPKEITDADQSGEKNAVRLMTMHKSKGLEFPVVFVCGLGDDKTRKDIQGSLLINSEYGIGADIIDRENSVAYNTLSRSAVKCKIKEEKIGEEMRLLYVALTRAKDKLIMTGTISNFEKIIYAWEAVNITGGFTKNTLLANDKFINWIMPSAINSPFFNIKTYDFSDITLSDTVSCVQKKSENYDDDESIFEDDYNYERTTLPVKVTVSQVNKLTRDTEIEKFYIALDDLDSMENTYSAAEYGTYFHKIFELIDHNEIKSGKKAEDIIEGLIKNGKIEEYDFTKKAIEGIRRFYETDVGKELLEADKVYKEKPFLVRISAKDIYNTQTDDSILLQGTSDCYFIKNNEITLIDFKTNKNPDADVIKAEYSRQLELYGYAIEKVTELKVIKKVIYTSENGGIIEMK